MSSRSRRPSVAIIVDHPQRDLAGLVLTAFELCQHGVICYLVPLNLQEPELWALAPDFVLLNFFRRGTEELASRLAEAGISMGVLDTEGGVDGCTAYTELVWPDAALRQKVRCACVWGPRIAQHLIEGGVLAGDQVFTTGCPRFDFYHATWQSVLQDHPGRATDRILINTACAIANPRFATLAQNVRSLREVLGWSPERIDSLIETQLKAIDATLRLAQDLARDYAQVEIIVRPHPFEKVDRYSVPLDRTSNITVDNSRPVQGEISRSSVVIQRGSTTAIEAGLARVPVLSPQWVPVAATIPNEEVVSVPCDSYEDLCRTVDAILAGRYQVPDGIRRAVDSVARDWFHHIDGLAYRRVSDAVAQCLSGERRVNAPLCRRFQYGLDGSRLRGFRDIGRLLRYRLGLSPDWSFRHMRTVRPRSWEKTAKYFGAEDVRGLADRISRAHVSQSHTPRFVHVSAAREQGAYAHGHVGHAVSLWCEP